MRQEILLKKFLSLINKNKNKGLKILTPHQILGRLPITLAKLKAGNNSEKLKNKIRQILLFFVQIKKTYKTNL